MACSRFLLCLLLFCAFSAVLARRLPRGFSPAMYCSACRAVATQIHTYWSSADDSEMIDSGSYRLSGTGKQPGRKKVPYKGSDLHITTVLDNACEKISDQFVRFEQYPDVFVEKKFKSNFQANTTGDCKPVRALYGLCSNIVDENEDVLQSTLKGKTVLDIDVWTEEFCNAGGILAGACVPKTDPGFAKRVVDLLKLEEQRNSNEVERVNGDRDKNAGESLKDTIESAVIDAKAGDGSKDDL